MPDDRWQFWLDVGGTFTDCIARQPDGTLLRRKVLSSAAMKGRARLTAEFSLFDSSRAEPAGFWIGYLLRMVNDEGTVIGQSVISGFSKGRFGFDSPLIGADDHRQYELVSPEEAPLLAIRLFLGLRLDQPIPPCIVRLGTTRGTNALLTRRGAKTALVTTKGHADVLRIGYQNRPKLFELAIEKSEPLFSEVAEIDERVAADGSILVAPDRGQVCEELARLKTAGIESLAICLLNAYAYPVHETFVGQIARELGFANISLSHQASPLMKIVPRGDTTVVDAYLNPVLQTYVARLAAALPGSDVRLMTSAGGLVSAANFTGKDSILSGPAGGVVGFSKVAQSAGFDKAIGFDMGGTSTDVSRFDGKFEYEYETEKAGVRIVAPMLAIETVAAGGGSICKWDGVKLTVGPDSAGADPGPACYGRGGPLTITDCNFYLGRILPEHFPFPLDLAAVEARLAEIAAQLASIPAASGGRESPGMSPHREAGASGSPVTRSPAELAAGFVRIANTHMAQAIRSISIAKGFDVRRDYALVAFGSAGPQHACAVARELDIDNVLIHPDAGVLSALGMGLADVVKHRTAGVYRRLDPKSYGAAKTVLDELESAARAEVAAEGIAAERITAQRLFELRYLGTDATLAIAEPTDGRLSLAFATEHRRKFGHYRDHPLEIVALRVEALGRAGTVIPNSSRISQQGSPLPLKTHEIYAFDRNWPADVFDRPRLVPGDLIRGPAIIVEPLTSTVVDPGWQAEVQGGGELLLSPHQKSIPIPPVTTAAAGADQCDPILLEVLSNHFTAIATQMGIELRSTATSVNVKERLDFSCAVFTKTGDLVVNAPHIPVHLGAMSATVKQVIAEHPRPHPGETFVTNDPYRGGSHLPDVTVVTAVYVDNDDGLGESLVFYVASRAHHAEIGGITPGSMPPFSRSLAEEGVLIRTISLREGGGFFGDDHLRDLLTNAIYPSRSVETNLADIRAQHGAHLRGYSDLREMCFKFSASRVESYMHHLQDAAERKLRAAFAKMTPGRREFVDHLDDGTPICVAITIEGDSATIDFTGTGPVSKGNLNANRAIVSAAVIYVLRLLVDEDIPLNQGVLAPVKIVLPECILNPPERERPEDCPAVVGGNVETSQRVVDVLLGALGLAAASQGTMNNVLFGDATFGYYETICGGSGATASADGADAVQIHMTNTRLTDPEVLEARYPVRLREFSIRRGSGGAGQHRGGDGTRRVIEFLKPLTLSILSQRRGPYPPYGLEGGQPGALGKNTLTRADGRSEELPHAAHVEVQPGNILTIETPGGGGFGKVRAAAE